MSRRPHIALVTWSGRGGGAESFTLELAHALREVDAEPGVVFVTRDHGMRGQLEEDGIRVRALGMERGSRVLIHPRRLVRAVGDVGRDGAIVMSVGYLVAALRFGKFRAPILAVEHGRFLQPKRRNAFARCLRALERAAGIHLADVHVVVSERVRKTVSTRELHKTVRIHNGVKPSVSGRRQPTLEGKKLTVGVAGRLIPEKGMDDALRAVADVRLRDRVVLRVAGAGPERERLESLAGELGVTAEFVGWVEDIRSFWNSCDVAVVPSRECVESFGMVALEAMATGIPVIATANGALTEVVADRETGWIVRPGDHRSVAGALAGYLADPALRMRHGAAGLERCRDQFSARRAATEYLRVLKEAAR